MVVKADGVQSRSAVNVCLVVFIFAVLAVSVTACGGGGGGGSPNTSTPQLVDWSNSDNGTIIKDANNEDFGVTVGPRQIYSFKRQVVITNTRVDGNATLFVDGQVIGSVVLSRSTTGGQVAVFGWLDPSDGQTKLIDVSTDASGNEVFTLIAEIVDIP